MIQVPVRTLWNGQVGVNEETYIKPALVSNQGLYIQLVTNGEVMEVSADLVESNQVGRSEHKFRDKFGGPDYYLVYYKWVPTARQAMLAI